MMMIIAQVFYQIQISDCVFLLKISYGMQAEQLTAK